MSDSHLRQIERQSEPDNSQSAVAHLLAKMRGGLLTLEQVKIAAYFGHSAARLALGKDAPASGIEGWHKWCQEVALIIAERALLEAEATPFEPHKLSFEGPRGTNDRRRFRPPDGSMIRAQIGKLDHWAVEAGFGEGEIVRVTRSAKRFFPSLAHFWLDAVFLSDEPATTFYSGQTLMEIGLGTCLPAKAYNLVRDCQLGPNRQVAEFWDITPIVFGLAFDLDWDESFYVWETAQDFLCYEWSTDA